VDRKDVAVLSTPDTHNPLACLPLSLPTSYPSLTTCLQSRGYRKDIADLLKAGKLDYAIIRVESVIREQLTLTGKAASP
jgi:hypothetical protein